MGNEQKSRAKLAAVRRNEHRFSATDVREFAEQAFWIGHEAGLQQAAVTALVDPK